MQRRNHVWMLAALTVGVVLPVLDTARAQEATDGHAVFAMTNDAISNEVVAYQRTASGTLFGALRYKTEGRGSGGRIDPLASQGALTLSQDRSMLFAVNAGSGTLSMFRVSGAQLELSDVVATEGSEPNAVAQRGNLVYVLNTAGTSSVVGFRLNDGKLERIDGSLRFLSGNGTGSASLAFSPDGEFLLVTERTTNDIDVFSVQPDGTLSAVTVNPSASAGAFAVSFAPNGTALVAETGPGAANGSTISSYSVRPDRTLTPISSSIPTLGSANCWVVVAGGGRFAYTSNSLSSSISGFAIGSTGALTPLPGTVVAINPPGSINLEIVVSSDNKFLYALDAGSGSISAFAINPQTGTLVGLGEVSGLPASAGLEGLAAN